MDSNKTKIVELNLNEVLPNRFQPRIKFNEEAIIELSESIKEHGVLQPILVRPIGDRYEIVAGERRYKGAVLAGLDTIPAMIIDTNDKDSAEIALIENVQRQDLNPIEEAISYKKILDMGYLTQEQLASKLGMSQSTIANKKRLLNLSDEVQEALMEDKISERHARSLLRVTDSNDQVSMLKRIIKDRLTVRKLDEEINKLLDGDKSVLDIAELENQVIETKSTIEIVEEKDEVIDISDLFDDIDFKNMQSLISEDTKEEEKEKIEDKKEEIKEEIKEEKVEEPKEEKEEIDDMNNNRFLNIDDNSNNMNNSFNNMNMNNGFNNPNQNMNSNSMFSNLMSPNNNTSNETIDEATFKKFLDPTYVDGNNNNLNQTNNMNDNVFSKFITNDNSSNNNEMMNNLLAPQTEQSNISGMLSSQTNSPNINDLMAPQSQQPNNMNNLLTPQNSQPDTISAVNFNDVISDNKPNNNKPDLLAPMGNDIPSFNVTEEVEEQKPDFLTPDNSFNIESEPFRPIEEAPKEENVPIFVTASSTNSDISMPTSPIIDNPEISDLLKPQVGPVESVVPVVEEKEEEEVINPVLVPENQARVDMINSINPNVGGLDGNSIIIDDYEKQYDPIIPEQVKTVAPTVDLRTVINMIRDLNNKIEGLGFSIDTDEYDLDDVYQVVIKIDKK